MKEWQAAVIKLTALNFLVGNDDTLPRKEPGITKGTGLKFSKAVKSQALFDGKRLLIGLLILIPILGRAQTNTVLAPHIPDLVTLQEGKLAPLTMMDTIDFLKAPYTVLYFGAGWCPDCRRFSPALVSAYNHQDVFDQRFEVVLISADKTAADMLKYMQSEGMKWPAVAFDKLAGNDLKKYETGRFIPYLAVIDKKGTLVLQSKSDQDGADVLKQLLALVARK